MDNVEVLDMGKEEKSKPKINVIIIVTALVIIGLIVGYFIFVKGKTDKVLEDKIKVASSDYFEKYVSTNDITSVYVITLDMLQDANSNGESYDLKGLEKCDTKSTLSRVTINFKTGEPKDIEVELKC